MIQFGFTYFLWHYTRAISDLFTVSKNFLWFTWHFFSIGVLSQTLFAPWQKLDEQYARGFDIGAFFETFVVNTLMRIIGFFIRLSVIVLGLIAFIIVFALEIIAFIIWLLFPFIIAGFFISGVNLFLK